jgi:hypothetical protein
MSGEDGNKQYRNSVFCSYFNDPERLLSLCNAVLGTKYTDATKLKINTLEGMFFDDQKNDISCTIENHFLVLIEHQTSVNNNMPFRCLSYVAELLNKLVEDKQKIYRKKLIKFPAPKFFVLYDGNQKEPLTRKMKLSDAFGGDSTSLELIVTAYNINHGLKQPLLQKCNYLNEYSILVGKVKEGIKAGLIGRDAIANAVKFCIANGIMKGYLENHSEEVFNMLALQWDKDSAMKASYDDGKEDGISQGVESVALKMIRRGKSFEEIQADTDLPIKRIEELATLCKD